MKNLIQNYNIPTKIVYGDNSIESLREIDSKNICIVTEKAMIDIGLADYVTEILKDKKLSFAIFDEVEPDPTMKIVSKGIVHLMKNKPDTIIALGGGSSIDTAKAIIYFNLLIQEKILPKEKIQKLGLIAIPTTSGTGSEVTSYSVITDKENNKKIPLVDVRIIPDIAILDTRLTASLPQKIIADSGIDVLTHAIEAYVSNKANAISKAFATEAIKLVHKSLLRMYKNVSDEEARKDMHIASCMAGMAFESSSLGINHGIAHSLGGNFKVAHGRLNGILMPYVITFNAGLLNKENNEVIKEYAEIASLMDIDGKDDFDKVKSLIFYITKLKEELCIPKRLSELAIDQMEYMTLVPKMVDATMKDITTGGNPVKVDAQDIENLYINIY